MLKTIVSAILFSFFIIGIILWSQRFEEIDRYKTCYDLAYRAYTKTGYLSLQSYTSEEEICKRKKSFIEQSMACFKKTDTELVLADGEKSVIKRIALLSSFHFKTLDDVIKEHNRVCAFKDTLVNN